MAAPTCDPHGPHTYVLGCVYIQGSVHDEPDAAGPLSVIQQWRQLVQCSLLLPGKSTGYCNSWRVSLYAGLKVVVQQARQIVAQHSAEVLQYNAALSYNSITSPKPTALTASVLGTMLETTLPPFPLYDQRRPIPTCSKDQHTHPASRSIGRCSHHTPHKLPF